MRGSGSNMVSLTCRSDMVESGTNTSELAGEGLSDRVAMTTGRVVVEMSGKIMPTGDQYTGHWKRYQSLPAF